METEIYRLCLYRPYLPMYEKSKALRLVFNKYLNSGFLCAYLFQKKSLEGEPKIGVNLDQGRKCSIGTVILEGHHELMLLSASGIVPTASLRAEESCLTNCHTQVTPDRTPANHPSEIQKVQLFTERWNKFWQRAGINRITVKTSQKGAQGTTLWMYLQTEPEKQMYIFLLEFFLRFVINLAYKFN